MTEASFEPPDHPPPLLWAALARGEITDTEKASYASHLAQCRRCMAVYAEFTVQVLGEPQATVPPSWVDRAMTIPQPDEREAKPRPKKRRVRWAWGAALASVVVLGLVLVNRTRAPDSVPDALQSALSAELRADSQGSLVYGDQLPPEPRGVRGSSGDDNSTLDELLKMYRAHPSDPETAYWLVSTYLAHNQLRNADPFLREALRNFPEDPRFLNLAAILAYKENRLDNAEA